MVDHKYKILFLGHTRFMKTKLKKGSPMSIFQENWNCWQIEISNEA